MSWLTLAFAEVCYIIVDSLWEKVTYDKWSKKIRGEKNLVKKKIISVGLLGSSL